MESTAGLERGQRVVVQTERGPEQGTVVGWTHTPDAPQVQVEFDDGTNSSWGIARVSPLLSDAWAGSLSADELVRRAESIAAARHVATRMVDGASAIERTLQVVAVPGATDLFTTFPESGVVRFMVQDQHARRLFEVSIAEVTR